MLKSLYTFFSRPKVQAFSNAVLLFCLIIGNYYWQVLCRPTFWAGVVLILCFISTIIHPMVKKEQRILYFVVSFFNGVALVVFLYFIIFLEHMNFYGFIFMLFGIGVLTYFPHVLVVQLFRKYVMKNNVKYALRAFLSGVLASIILVLVAGLLYANALNDFNKYKENNYRSVEPNFINEKILGMHFKYHTRYCEYDGWRPPIHEPILVLGMWLNGRRDPIDLNLESRIALYKKVFPNNPVKQSCSCAKEGRWSYFNDELLD